VDSADSSCAKSGRLERRAIIIVRTRRFIYHPLSPVETSYGAYHTSDGLLSTPEKHN
jgi:hypothetical protein